MLDFIQVTLAGIVAILSALALRENGKLSRLGKWSVSAAVVAFVVAGAQVRRNKIDQENQAFRFNEASSLQLTLSAEYYAPDLEETAFLRNVPKEFTVEDAELGARRLDFEFISVQDVWHPPRSRILTSGHVFYVAHQFRSSDVRDKPSAFRYLWDLDGATLRFRIPVHKFRPLHTGQNWDIRGTLSVGGQAMRAYADDQGDLDFRLTGLNEKILKEPK